MCVDILGDCFRFDVSSFMFLLLNTDMKPETDFEALLKAERPNPPLPRKMSKPLHLLYLDRYHLDDTLFVQALARTLAGAGRGVPPCVIVHGSGERAERMLEGEGLFVERENGVLRGTSPEEAALLDRALREANRKLVGVLTDAVVYAVGVQGADRRLLHLGEDGRLGVGKAEWVRELASKGAVPVIAATVHDSEGPHLREAGLAEAAIALGHALGGEDGGVEVVFFTKTNRPGLLDGTDVRPEVAPAALAGETALAEPEAVRRVAEAGLAARLTNVGGFVSGGGTRVVFGGG